MGGERGRRQAGGPPAGPGGRRRQSPFSRRNVIIGFALPRDVHAKLKERAEAEGTTVSAILRALVFQYLAETTPSTRSHIQTSANIAEFTNIDSVSNNPGGGRPDSGLRERIRRLLREAAEEAGVSEDEVAGMVAEALGLEPRDVVNPATREVAERVARVLEEALEELLAG